MINQFQRIAVLFPGQGTQYPGMARDFFDNFALFRATFEEADDLLRRPLSKIVLEGSEESLKETQNSQTSIYVTGIGIWRVLRELSGLQPFVCAGLSLGEYTALTVGGWLSFQETLPLVQRRGQFMQEACEAMPGTMAVVMGLDGKVLEELVRNLHLPNDLWVANLNGPDQVVLSGTLKGIEAGIAAAKAHHAKRAIPLQVQGAFHSGLMQQAKERLAPYIQSAPMHQGVSQIVMNVPGDFISSIDKVRDYLIEQVTQPVRWEQGIRSMEREEVEVYVAFGPGNTLSGLNKRIGVRVPTLTIEKVEDLVRLVN